MRNATLACLFTFPAFGALALAAFGCHRTPEEPVTATAASGGFVESLPAPAPPSPLAVPTCPSDPEPHLGTLPSGTVSLPEAEAGAIALEVEIARTPHDSERG